jgi:RND family efflux transporter MFP subunit
MKNIPIIIAILATAFLASCGSDDKKVTVDNSPTISVIVSPVANNENNPFLSLSGKIQSENSATLSTRMMGFVNSVSVNVGDKVTKGQLLVSINNADLQAKKAQVSASITEAKAAFTNAEKNYNRFKNLFADKSASQKELDDITANYQMAKARLEAANQLKNEIDAQFSYSNITAPFSGIVTSKMIEKGDMANPGQPLISIESPGNFEVMAMVPESEITAIKTGISVDVVVKSINQTLKGIVKEVSTSSKNTGGQFLVKIGLTKSEVAILSGMFATVQFPIAKNAKTTSILIPTDVIVSNGQLSGVYTVSQSNTAMLRWLTLGKTYGNQVEVLSGLNADESYIVSANGKLFNGAKVIPSSILPKGKEVQ